MQKNKRLKQNIVLASIAALLILLIWLGTDGVCLIKGLTGLSCPFCGMSRAHIALFSGGFSAALYYHPVFFLGIPVFLLFGICLLLPERPKWAERLLIALTLIIFLVYIYRLLFLNSEIVSFDTHETFYYRIFKN